MRRNQTKTAGTMMETRIYQVEEGRYQVRCGRKSRICTGLEEAMQVAEEFKREIPGDQGDNFKGN